MFILGSKSITRRKILKDLGFHFRVVTADVDEKKIRDKNPRKLVLKLAHLKAEAIKIKLKSGILVTCDQVSYLDKKILEKAKNLKEAKKFLESYSGKTVANITGIVITDVGTGRQAEGVDVTKISFKTFNDDLIKKALSDKNVLSYCGAAVFGQDIWKPYIKEIIGDKTALFGISVKLMNKLMIDVVTPLSLQSAQKLVRDFAKRNLG